MLMYVLIIFVTTSRGFYPMPTTEFKNLKECQSLALTIDKLDIYTTRKPICQPFYKSEK